ncbi:putative exported protein [Halobacteriovorax marinus SJ]|uniref:Exported protein n=1 Tax=Halobacteriovorax marinus (strain ATCC BAA-682 / DSM 15412 / SJ) TaxID=862908 RepID=E1X5I6_HALMS|nr:hypothetical protein [Halobacteriovorax marinus]CBW27307.1 putative exported protein [Halobacteriovorax marinus SJ]
MMKGMITILMLLALSYNIQANDELTNGEGRFVSRDGDSLTFVKKQLLYASVRDIISKELSKMGHNSEVFWAKYNEKFDSYFAPIKEKLDKSYGLTTPETKLSGSKKEKYDNELRSKKLTLKARYGKLEKVLSSYSVKKMSRSPQFPNSRYMNIQAKVNRKLINEIFYGYTRGGEKRFYKNLFLTVDFSMRDMSWQDLGVELENDFTSVLKEHWKRWFEDKFKGKVSNVIITTSYEEEKLQSHLKMLSEASMSLNKISNIEGEIEQSQESALLSVDDQLKDSLWMKVKVNIKKVSEDTTFKKRTFDFGGEYLLFDLQSNRLASHYDFISEEATYSTVKDLSSNSASLVYRLPIAKWDSLIRDISHFPLGRKSFRVDIIGANSVRQIDEVEKYLTSMGLTYSLKVKIDSFNRERAQLRVFFKGSVEDLKGTLLRTKNLEVDNQKRIFFQDEENPFMINLVDKEIPVSEKTESTQG